ncbi:MAG: small acid-soluble spore protein Tlp [Limnochordia bacterium]|jgi:small acid-soluble spore protein (thioredoxin-like protein)
MGKKPHNKKERVEYLEQQIENTLENLQEAEETLHHDDLPEEEERRVSAKNAHRRDTVEQLKAEIEDELN